MILARKAYLSYAVSALGSLNKIDHHQIFSCGTERMNTRIFGAEADGIEARGNPKRGFWRSIFASEGKIKNLLHHFALMFVRFLTL